MAFLGGLLSTLGPMLPGIIGTVGDIVKRVANRPEGQSFGSALLGAAPAALSGISGVAKQLAPALGGTAGGVLSKIGQGADLAGQFVGTSAKAPILKSFDEWIDHAYPDQYIGDFSGSGGPDDTPEEYIRNGIEWLRKNNGVPAIPISEQDIKLFAIDKARHDKRWDTKPYDAPIGPEQNAANEAWMKDYDKEDVTSSAPPSPHAVDMLPMRHGAINGVPPMIAGHQQNQSGPFASHTMPPAELYNEDRSDASPGAQPREPFQGFADFGRMHKREPSAYERQVSQSMHPNAQVNYRGAPTMVDRTQQQSFGNAPSFNVFDKLAAAPPQREQAIAQVPPEIPANIMAGYNKWIKRKDKKKARRR